MLLKYLNDLDRAVQEARAHPGPREHGRCMECVSVLQDYLAHQSEPVQRRGREIMDELLPDWRAAGEPRNGSQLTGAV